MDINHYQLLAQRTAQKSTAFSSRFAVAGLGLAGEAGEVADYIKKCVGHGHDFNRDEMINELGDVLWYVAEVASIIGVPLGEVAQRNVNKLLKRYPQGFSTADSIKRVDVEE